MAAGKDEAHLGPGGTIFTKQGEEERGRREEEEERKKGKKEGEAKRYIDVLFSQNTNVYDSSAQFI